MDEYKFGDVDLNDEKLHPNYKKGFEHGYWLQRGGGKYLDEVINGSKNYAPYRDGLLAGKKEADREKVKTRLQGNSDQSKTPDKGIDMD